MLQAGIPPRGIETNDVLDYSYFRHTLQAGIPPRGIETLFTFFLFFISFIFVTGRYSPEGD